MTMHGANSPSVPELRELCTAERKTKWRENVLRIANGDYTSDYFVFQEQLFKAVNDEELQSYISEADEPHDIERIKRYLEENND